MRKRTYDLAGILGKGVKVYYNGERLAVKDFQSYVDMYLGPRGGEGATARVYERFGERWEVCVAPSDGQFNQVSFVNSICTSKGGTHVNYLADQVVKHVVDTMAKKHKQAGVKPFMVKNYLWVFVNCLVENPAFDSQTKDTLTLRASAFGSKCDLPDAYLKKVAAAGVADAVLNFASFKANKELKKGDGAKRARLTGIPKLDDANDAGGRNSGACTLILTEGDSAKSLAISGLSVVGRDRFGVFPLRGKLLNVRDAGAAQITGNAEINNIKQILGLQHGKVYTDAKSLRYGHLMIMTDQDHDGSHIKGLIMNFLHHFYPSLLQLPGFLVEFITPIIKATKGREAVSFFTLPEYESWREAVANPRAYKIKYYKGLGTSTAAEAKEYFSNIESHRKEFVWEGESGAAGSRCGGTRQAAGGAVKPCAARHAVRRTAFDRAAAAGPAPASLARAQETRTARPSTWRSARRRWRSARTGCAPTSPAPSWTTPPTPSPTTSSCTRSSSSSPAPTWSAPSPASWTASSPASARSCLPASSATCAPTSRWRSSRATWPSTRPTTTARRP